MAYHGHPSTGTEASLEMTRVLNAPGASGASDVPPQMSQTAARTGHRVGLIILVATVVIAGLVLAAYFLL